MANNAVLCMTEFTNSEYINNAACPNLVSCMNASDVREGKFIDDELKRYLWTSGWWRDDYLYN